MANSTEAREVITIIAVKVALESCRMQHLTVLKPADVRCVKGGYKNGDSYTR